MCLFSEVTFQFNDTVTYDSVDSCTFSSFYFPIFFVVRRLLIILFLKDFIMTGY